MPAADITIAVKIAHRIKNGNIKEDQRSKESTRILQSEIAVYKALSTKPPHPNIVQYFLSNDVALFMMYEPDTLAKRLDRQLFEPLKPISDLLKFRWIQKLASVGSWPEQLDYFHGDLQPGNILLDSNDHVKVCDFGRTTRRDQKFPAFMWPFYRPSDSGPIIAGPRSEQFSIGSCIYTIRNGHPPYGHPESGDDYTRMYEALLCGHFTPTEKDEVLGDVVWKCWNAEYRTIKEVKDVIILTINANTEMLDTEEAKSMDSGTHGKCLEQCGAFLRKEEELRGGG